MPATELDVEIVWLDNELLNETGNLVTPPVANCTTPVTDGDWVEKPLGAQPLFQTWMRPKKDAMQGAPTVSMISGNPGSASVIPTLAPPTLTRGEKPPL